MSDPRYAQLADVLTRFSTTLKKGERVLIDAFDVPDAFTIAPDSGGSELRRHALCKYSTRARYTRALARRHSRAIRGYS